MDGCVFRSELDSQPQLPGKVHHIFWNRLAFGALKNEREVVFRGRVLHMCRTTTMFFEI